MALTKPSSAHTTFSLFNELPSELRLKVYEYALATPEILSIVRKDYLQPGEICAWSPSIFQSAALLRSSWKIYNEALPAFYAVNYFEFDLFADWNYSKRSTTLSNHIAMIRHIYVGAWIDKPWLTDDLCASRLKEILHRFPRLHSFAFFFYRGYPRVPCPSLNETAETLRDLRQRLDCMTIMFNFDDDENLQGLRDVIAPHDEWRHETGEGWHGYIVEPSGQAGVCDTNRPGCRIEEL